MIERKPRMGALEAEVIVGQYETATRDAARRYRRFYRSINAATSKFLPAPYPGISRKLADWAPVSSTA